MSAETPLAALTYPELNDSPNVPRDMQELAQDVERELYGPFICTSSTRPAAGLVTVGQCIRESDTGDIYLWDGSAWVFLLNSSGGSSGGSAGGSAGSWHHSTTQAIGTANTVVAFNTEDIAAAVVTRSSQGSGHKFTFTESGLYAVSVCLAYGVGVAGNRYCQVTNVAGNVGHGAANVPAYSTGVSPVVNLAFTKRFAANDAIVVVGSQSGQSNLTAQGLHLDIAKIAA